MRGRLVHLTALAAVLTYRGTQRAALRPMLTTDNFLNLGASFTHTVRVTTTPCVATRSPSRMSEGPVGPCVAC